MTEALLTPKAAAAMLDISVRQLRRLPIQKVKIGRLVRYQLPDIELYVSLHLESPRKRARAA